jgi:hypothetical protein
MVVLTVYAKVRVGSSELQFRVFKEAFPEDARPLVEAFGRKINNLLPCLVNEKFKVLFFTITVKMQIEFFAEWT